MHSRLLMFVAIFLLAFGCRTDIDEAPEAQVSETSAQTQTPQTSTQTPTSTGQVVKDKSKIEFIGAKVTGQHVGQFHEFDGKIEYVGATPSAIDFTINLGSVKTDAAKLDAHLKSPDFFDVARYPTATFRSKSITPGGAEGGTHTISGTLTMHGVSKDVSFPANVQVMPDGIHATSKFRINRHDWGISYKGMPDDLIRDDVAINLDLWFPPPPAA